LRQHVLGVGVAADRGLLEQFSGAFQIRRADFALEVEEGEIVGRRNVALAGRLLEIVRRLGAIAGDAAPFEVH